MSLWEAPALTAGALRRSLTAAVRKAHDDGHDLPDDLILVALSLADRIDWANARGERRGFVMLTAEYRSARAQLFDGLAGAADDGFEAAMGEFLSNADV